MESIRQRPSTGAIVMSLETFQGSSYPHLCQQLGLRPSMPRANADQAAKGETGQRRRRRRRRRSGGGSGGPA